ncbi:MAG: hypothetical protein CMM94_00915 [Rickettsiales bacterium]|nr:hypothetical protein [Rickettsiales bacterium]|tara:strand:- start:154 stop:447 length:294 start_codon:yes stop_codon:yes gene_type:complete
MKRPEIYLPLALIALLMLPVLYATYGSPKEGWVFAKYPDENIPAFVVASAYVDAIADSSAERNSVTVKIHNDAQKQQLRASGAWLFDVQGVPLCLQP